MQAAQVSQLQQGQDALCLGEGRAVLLGHDFAILHDLQGIESARARHSAHTSSARRLCGSPLGSTSANSEAKTACKPTASGARTGSCSTTGASSPRLQPPHVGGGGASVAQPNAPWKYADASRNMPNRLRRPVRMQCGWHQPTCLMCAARSLYVTESGR